MIDFIDELRWRGLFHQSTDEAALRAHLADPRASPRRAYAGFDPTGESLTIGNLVPIMMLVHFARAGHTPIVVMGGGTGLIGDPSGKSAERQLMTEERVRRHVELQRPIFERVFANAGLKPPTILNNLDWLGALKYIKVLRDVGKHFSVNMMIQKESVRERLHNREQGISYTEFSYMILQAYDFYHLYAIKYPKNGVSVQLGGSDQYGNILAGCDIIRRVGADLRARASFAFSAADDLAEQGDAAGAQAQNDRGSRLQKRFMQAGGYSRVDLPKMHREFVAADGPFEPDVQWAFQETRSGWDSFGLTAPLVTKADGGKFGKTESGAVWLSAPSTTAYAMFQFWLNASDADAGKYLRLFTLMNRAEIESLEAEHARAPQERHAQRALARAATALVHGPEEAEAAEHAARALFSGDIARVPEAMLREALAEAPATRFDPARLDGQGASLIDVLAETGLADSRKMAKEFLASGSVGVNGARVEPDHRLTRADLMHGSLIALRRGKKTWHLLLCDASPT
ncbi:MAG: tyrosine--tRNA ligase [Phycisphaeraceae bacterium]|nr:tyrosine--tRNA ligase [Phycisphaeraceae bacterium]